MSTFEEALEHVRDGGRAWETRTWDTNSYLFCEDGGYLIYCGYDDSIITLETLGNDDRESVNWELFD